MAKYRSILGMAIPVDDVAKRECLGLGVRYRGVDVRRDPELKIRAARAGQSLDEYFRLEGVDEATIKEANELHKLGPTLKPEEKEALKHELKLVEVS